MNVEWSGDTTEQEFAYIPKGMGTYEVWYRGVRSVVSGSNYDSPDAMRKAAQDYRLQASRLLRDADRCEALADAVEADRRAADERARAERNRKAAATRAKNKDPFGFGALLDSSRPS